MRQKSTLIAAAGFLILGAAIFFSACKKDSDSTSANTDQTTATSLSSSGSTSESLYDDAFDVVTQEGENNNVSGKATSCATVTLSPADTTSFPKTMTIDFGAGCTSTNGVTRKGKIIAALSGRIRATGTSIAVTFDNYSVNGYLVEGTYSITNNSGNGNGLNITTQVTNGKVTYPDGTTWYTYSGTHNMAQTAGTGTITFADDVYSITGNYTTGSSAGKNLSVTIITPLIKNAACVNIVSGIEAFTYNNISGTLDFGDGTCDKQATLTVGVKTETVILPR